MNNFNLKSMSASKFRLVLIGLVLLIIVAQIGLIALGQKAISGYGDEVSKSVSLSSSNEKTLRDLELVNTVLEKQKETVEKASRITVDKTDTYAYQNQIIREITAYTAKANMAAVGFSFSSATTDGTQPGAAAAPAPAPAADGTVATGAATAGPVGVTPVNVTVTLASGGSYEDFYTLLHLFEGSLLRMEVDGVNLSRPGASTDGSSSSAAPSTLNIKVYQKK